MAEDVQVIVEPTNRGTLRITWDMSTDIHQQLEAYCAEKNFTPAAKCAHHYEVFVLLGKSLRPLARSGQNPDFPYGGGLLGRPRNSRGLKTNPGGPDFQEFLPIRAGVGPFSRIPRKLPVWSSGLLWAGSELTGRATTGVSDGEVPLAPWAGLSSWS